jgi:hypothetical protein
MQRWLLDSATGGSFASLGSISTPTIGSHASFMVEWRPLPPLASATVNAHRGLWVIFNLHTLMSTQRHFGFIAVDSLLAVPSAGVPCDGEGDCDDVFCGGEGAVLDCISRKSVDDLGAKCKDLLVISFFVMFLSVSCMSIP